MPMMANMARRPFASLTAHLQPCWVQDQGRKLMKRAIYLHIYVIYHISYGIYEYEQIDRIIRDKIHMDHHHVFVHCIYIPYIGP